MCSLQYMRNISIPVPFVGKIRFFELFPVILAIICAWVLGIIITSGEPLSPACLSHGLVHPTWAKFRCCAQTTGGHRHACGCLQPERMTTHRQPPKRPAALTRSACCITPTGSASHTPASGATPPSAPAESSPCSQVPIPLPAFIGYTCMRLMLAGRVITDSITCLQAPYLP